MNPPKMPVHIGDLMRDTAHLRAAAFGAYLSLLFHHWSTGELPDDDDQLSAIARMTRTEWNRARPILERFFEPGWHHGRVEKDLAAARASYEKRAKAGEKGGKAKAESKQSSSNATAGPEQPLTFNQAKEEDTADAVSSSEVQNGKYAFSDGIIRLSREDFEKWKAAYSHLHLAAELMGLSKWAEEQGPQRWFHAVKSALAKKNREAAERAAKAKSEPEFKYNGGMEGIV